MLSPTKNLPTQKKIVLCFQRIFFSVPQSKEKGNERRRVLVGNKCLFCLLCYSILGLAKNPNPKWKILTVRDDNRNKMKLFSDRPTLLQNLGLGVDKSTFFKASLTSLKIKNIIRMMGHFFMSPPLSIDIMYNYIFSLTSNHYNDEYCWILMRILHIFLNIYFRTHLRN